MATKKVSKSHKPSTSQAASKKTKASIHPQDRRSPLDSVGISSGEMNTLPPPDSKKSKHPRQNYESFYMLFHANPIPTMLTRLSDNIIMNVNLAFLEYMNLKREDVVGHKVQDFRMVLKEADKSLLGRNIRNHEQEITLPHGEKKTMLTSTQRIHVENTDAILLTFIDITDRVHAERQVRILNIERASAELSERRRIAQLLHDDLQQRIFAIKMHLERLEEGFANQDADAVKEDFAKLEAWLIEAIAMTRKLSSDISPLSVSGSTLSEVILWLAAEMNEQYGLITEFEGNGAQPNLNSNMLSILLQALRELLFNVVKHAGTNQATIELEKSNNHSIRIIVSDKGKGFDTEGTRKRDANGGGLANIRHQLSIFGCTFEINSELSNGTRAIIGVPIRKSESQP